MRIWKGIEREGRCREMTLFVCSDTIDEVVTQIVSDLKEKYGIKRVYLGAGNVAVWHFYDYTLLEDEDNVIEVPYDYYNLLRIEKVKARIVFTFPRHYKNSHNHKISFKVEQENEVLVYEKFVRNSTKSVKRGLYKKDELVWED